jgi:hypothetical protein
MFAGVAVQPNAVEQCLMLLGRNIIHTSQFLATLSKNILNFHYSTKLGQSQFSIFLAKVSLSSSWQWERGIFLAHIPSMFRTDILRNQHKVKNTEKYEIIKGAWVFEYPRLAFLFP